MRMSYDISPSLSDVTQCDVSRPIAPLILDRGAQGSEGHTLCPSSLCRSVVGRGRQGRTGGPVRPGHRPSCSLWGEGGQVHSWIFGSAEFSPFLLRIHDSLEKMILNKATGQPPPPAAPCRHPHPHQGPRLPLPLSWSRENLGEAASRCPALQAGRRVGHSGAVGVGVLGEPLGGEPSSLDGSSSTPSCLC